MKKDLDLMEINNQVIFHAEKNQKLMIEVYKYVNGLSMFIKMKHFQKGIRNTISETTKT